MKVFIGKIGVKYFIRIMLCVIVISGAFSMFLPFLWMIVTSLKDDPQVFTWPPQWIPNPIKFLNYKTAWTIAPFSRFFFNSAFISVSVTSVSLFFNSLAGFAFAKYDFPFRDAIFIYLLATMMVPFHVTMIPTFILLKFLGWLDSFYGLIIPGFASAFGVFFMRQFFQTIPSELIDAARIDGCPDILIFLKIMIPLAKPALATLGIFTFMGSWNNFIWPLIVVKSNEMRTLPLAVAALAQGLYVMSYPVLMAAATITIIPVIIVFFFAQRYFIQGIALTGLKE